MPRKTEYQKSSFNPPAKTKEGKIMAYEKSCGSVLYRTQNEFRILVIKQAQNGNWSFPKGHVEANETEEETAKREVFEEVGIKVDLIDGFRETIRYNPRPNIEKDVVYFVADSKLQSVRLQKEEVADYKWLRPAQAFKALTFKNDKDILKKALDFLKKNNIA